MALKKDNLWVKWIHGKYLREQQWPSYNHPPDCSWYWKKIVQTKTTFLPLLLSTPSPRPYKVTAGYLWLIGTRPRPAWCNLLWTRVALPRHRFITWLFLHRRLPVKTRLACLYGQQNDVTCGLCGMEEETQDHLFLACPWS